MWDELPEGYRRCIERMLVGARAWIKANGRGGLTFTLPPVEVGVIAPLDGDKVFALLSPTKMGREFLLAIDVASGHEATVMQAGAVVRVLGLPFVDWSEEFCARLVSRGGVLS